ITDQSQTAIFLIRKLFTQKTQRMQLYNSKISGLGYYVPDHVVTNDDLTKIMDTSDEWIQERTGIQERRWVKPGSGETTSSMGVKAAHLAIERSGLDKEEID